MLIKEMQTDDIKCMLTTMNRQLDCCTDCYQRESLNEFYKDFIIDCEEELKKRGVNYESCNIGG